MIVRIKGGGAILRIASEFSQGENSTGAVFAELDSKGLLEFLGVNDTGKPVKVAPDIELIVPAPFCLAADGRESSDSVPWVFSTFDLDRYDERVDPAGWDFKRYLQNPVVEWAHRYDIPAIGRAEGLYADEKGLHGNIVFNGKDYDPFGWAIGERVRNGVIQAGSVGFRVLEIEIPAKKDGEDGTSLIFRKQELLEFSICNVPANPFALAKDFAGAKEADMAPDFWGGIINSSGYGPKVGDAYGK
jgi:HK97 family phage prohead protease